MEDLYSLVTIRAETSRFIIFGTIYICRVVEHSISNLFNRSPSSLIVKMPIETCKWFMLCTFMLEEGWTLFNSEFFKVSAKR